MLTLDYLKTLSKEDRQKEVFKEFLKCRKDPIYTIQTYFTVVEPIQSKRIPFILYPHQVDALKDFEEFSHNLSMKSRQMGFTTITAAYMAWFMSTKGHQSCMAMALDKTTARKFLRTVREFLDDARDRAPWLIPDYMENNNGMDSFTLKNKSRTQAEANKPDSGRGGTYHLCVGDEIAAISHFAQIWSSLGLTITRSNGKFIGISTPRGSSGWYYEQYTNAEKNGWNIVEAHWSQHPEFSKGMYQWIKDEANPEGGYVKHYNELWPNTSTKQTLDKYKTKETYDYITDGRLRSPWYDVESKKLGVQLTRCELDCSFAGSGSEVLDPEVIRGLSVRAKEHKPLDNELLGFTSKGLWKSLKIYKEYNPDHGYTISADVSTGDGSDYSAFVVIDITKKEIIASYKEIVDPHMYSTIIDKVGRYFGDALAIIEYQGPGLTVLLELKNRLGYRNVYYSDTKKNEPHKGQKKKLGFWQGNQSRTLGGDKLEEVFNSNEFMIYTTDLIEELHTWIWGKDGKRRHASEKHDDLIMAAANAMYYMYFVEPRRSTQRTMMRDHLDWQRIGSLSSNNNMFDDLFNMNQIG